MGEKSTKRPETILVVEDETMVRDLVRSVLEGSGHEVLEASGGNEALREYGDNSKTIDLLLTDIVMPGMSGPELARQLRATQPEIKVLYMSGYTEYALTDDGVMERVHSFIWKPFSTKDLLAKVREILGGDAPHD